MKIPIYLLRFMQEVIFNLKLIPHSFFSTSVILESFDKSYNLS